MNNQIKFGTDGWRGIIARDFTFENVQVCAQAAAEYLKETGLGGRGLIIGYDTRFASADFAAAAAEVICANRIKVYLCPHPTPTPIISYGVLARKAGGAVIITASHNPGAWNGFKFKTETGASATPEITARLEEHIARILPVKRVKSLPLPQALKEKRVEYLDLNPIYRKQLDSLIDLEAIKKSRLKVIIDPMFGAGIGYFKKWLGEESNLEILEINNEINPNFPGMKQPEPIAGNLSHLSETVKREGAAVGIATDGDADRLGIVDENGVFISTLHVFALLCLYLLEIRGERGPIVKTVTMSSMVYRLGEIFNVPVYETPVGFKYVAPMMEQAKALIGGEESGGYGFRGHVIERDGILAGLYFLDLMIKTGKSPKELIDYLHSKVGPHYYQRRDITFSEAEKAAIVNRVREYSPESIGGTKVKSTDTKDGFRFFLEDNSWLLIRFSQTEPLLRLYAEGGTEKMVEELLDAAQRLTGA